MLWKDGFGKQNTNLKDTTPAPLPGKFVDNEKHEFRASLKINLNALQLQTAIKKIPALSPVCSI